MSGYIERVMKCGSAIESGLRVDPIEVAAGQLVSGIRSKVRLPNAALKQMII